MAKDGDTTVNLVGVGSLPGIICMYSGTSDVAFADETVCQVNGKFSAPASRPYLPFPGGSAPDTYDDTITDHSHPILRIFGHPSSNIETCPTHAPTRRLANCSTSEAELSQLVTG